MGSSLLSRYKASKASGSTGRNVYKDSGKVKTYKQSAKATAKQYNASGGQVKKSSAYKKRELKEARTVAENKKAKEQKSPLSAVSKLFDFLAAPSAAVSQARYNYNTGKSVTSGLKKGFVNSIKGKQYKTNADVIKYKQSQGKAGLFNTYMASTEEGAYLQNGVAYHNNGQQFNESEMELGRNVVGFAEDLAFDPSWLTGGAEVKIAGKVLKGSGASLTTFRTAAKSMKETGTLAENAAHTSQLKSTRAVAKALWDDKSKKTALLTGTNKERVVQQLKQNKALSHMSDEELGRVAEDTIQSFKRNALRLDTSADELAAKIKGLNNTSFDKARGVLLKGKLTTIEGLQKAGDMTVAPYWNELTERLRTSRVGKAFSKQNAKEDLIKSNLLGIGRKGGGENQIDATTFVTKQALESGELKAMMNTDVMETAQRMETLVKDLTSEQQLSLLKSIENGDFEVAEKVLKHFGTREEAEGVLQTMRGNVKQYKDMLEEIITRTDIAKYSPSQYLYYSLYKEMPSVKTKDARIMALLDLKNVDTKYQDVDIAGTFLNGFDKATNFGTTGRFETNASEVARLYASERFRQQVMLATNRIKSGNALVGDVINDFVRNVGAEDAYRFLEDNAIFRKGALDDGLARVEDKFTEVGKGRKNAQRKGATVVLKATDTASLNALRRRGIRTPEVMEESYSALKNSAMEARIMGAHPELFKDAEDLVAFVESKATQSGGQLKDVLMTLTPEQRTAIIDSYATTAEGYESLFGKIEGQTSWERARIFAQNKGEDKVLDPHNWVNDYDREYLKDIAQIADLIDGRSEGWKLGNTLGEAKEHLDYYDRTLEKAENALGIFGDTEGVEFQLAKLFEDEMQRIGNAEKDAGRLSGAVWTEHYEGRKYVPHIQTNEYKNMTQTAEQARKEGQYSSIYSRIGNPYNKMQEAEHIDEVVVHPETNEEVQKLKRNITEIYLERALHSNTLLYNSEASEFLFRNCTNPRKIDENFSMDELFDGVADGNKVGTTFSSVNSEINKRVAKKIDQMATKHANQLLAEVLDDAGRTAEDYVKAFREARTETFDTKFKRDTLFRKGDSAKQFLHETEYGFREPHERKLGDMLDLGRSIIDDTNLPEEAKAIEQQGLLEGALMGVESGDSAEEILRRIGGEAKLREIERQASSYRWTIAELSLDREEAMKEVEELLSLEYKTPYSEEIQRQIEQLNLAKRMGDEQFTRSTLEMFNKLTDMNMDYLLHESTDFNYLNQLYRDIEEMDEEYRMSVEMLDDLEDIMGVYGGGYTVEELRTKFIKEFKEENFNELFDALKQTELEDLFGEERAGDFVSNIPLQELTRDEAKRVQAYVGDDAQFFTVDDKILNDVNVMTKSQYIQHERDLVLLYDRFLSMYKRLNTVTSPGFHTQNAISNQYQQFLGLGAHALNPTSVAEARTIISGKDPNKVVNLGGRDYSYRELQNMMQEMGVVSETFGRMNLGEDMFAKRSDVIKYMKNENGDITSPTGFEPIFKGWGQEIKKSWQGNGLEHFKNEKLNKVNKVFNTYETIVSRPSRNIGQQIESTQRGSMFINCLKEGKSPTEAVEMVNKFLFDYSELSDFERNVMRRIIPFYTYSRKNLPMHISSLINNPQRVGVFAKMQNYADNNPDQGYLPNNKRNIWTQQYMQIPGTNMGIDPKLPYNNAIQNNFDWRVKDMTSEDYGKLTWSSMWNNLIGELNNPLLNAGYTMLTGSQPRIYGEEDSESSLNTRGGKTIQGLSGTLGSTAMDVYSIISGFKESRAKLDDARTGFEKEGAEREFKKQQKQLIKELTNYFGGFAVDKDMYDYSDWKGYERKATTWDDETQKKETYKYYSNLTQKEDDKVFKDTFIKSTLDNMEIQSKYIKEQWDDQVNKYKGRYLEGKSKKEYLEETYYVKDEWKREKDMGATNLSYNEWFDKWFN